MNDIPEPVRAKISSNGRIVLPAKMRAAAGLEAGEEALVRVIDGEIRIYRWENALRQAQALMRRYTGGKKGLVEEFIRERRAEARREEREQAAQGRARKAHS